VTETPAIDVQLASDPTLVDDLPETAARLGTHGPEVRPSGHRWQSKRSPPRRERFVCYVPSVLMGDTAALPSIYFDDAWYHRWHLQLLQWMIDQPRTNFIWKALPSGDHATDPIVDAVRAAINVEYVVRPLPWVIDQASRVVTDFPSTPAYEAAWAGRPLLVLWFPQFSDLRPRALDAFGSVVRQCDDETTALAELTAWMADDPATSIVPQARLRPTSTA
jgi:hypothetical protein